MRYTVLVRRRPAGTYVAVAPAAPGCSGKGRTRDEALTRLKAALENWLIETEIATLEVKMPEPADGTRPNPWLMTAGAFVDDPTLEPMLREIYAAREAERPVAPS